MWSRVWRVAHPLVTLALVACCAYLLWRDSRRPAPAYPTSERLSAHEDTPLRNFLDVRWLGGDYELPSGEEHCVTVLLKFEDGKFKGGQQGVVFSPRPGGSRVVPFYVMWGPGPNGPRVARGWQGMWGSSNGDPFYADLNGGLHRLYGATKSTESVRGYGVIGHAASQQPRAGREQRKSVSGDVNFSIENRQRVLVLGLKPFATREEAEDWYENHPERADP